MLLINIAPKLGWILLMMLVLMCFKMLNFSLSKAKLLLIKVLLLRLKSKNLDKIIVSVFRNVFFSLYVKNLERGVVASVFMILVIFFKS